MIVKDDMCKYIKVSEASLGKGEQFVKYYIKGYIYLYSVENNEIA